MIYYDNASSTPMTNGVKRAVKKAYKYFANPSSLHKLGREANTLFVDAKVRMAKLLRCAPDDIYFTSGGTESDNWAIESACKYGIEKGKKTIITSCIEHHAVLNTLKQKEKEGFRVIYLPVDKEGVVNPEELKALLKDKELARDVCLVTIMLANNETGAIQPISELAALCHKKKITFHTDAVQAVGHLPIYFDELNVDMLSASAHKFHGPRGVGFLYVRRGTPIYPMILGGNQQRGMRSGTENLPGIIGMVEALEEAYNRIARCYSKDFMLKSKLVEFIHQEIADVIICSSNVETLPNIVNLCFKNIDGSTCQLFLDNCGVEVSVGSACSSGSTDPSYVLKAMNIPEDYIKGSIRISFSCFNTKRELKKFFTILEKTIKLLRNP